MQNRRKKNPSIWNYFSKEYHLGSQSSNTVVDASSKNLQKYLELLLLVVAISPLGQSNTAVDASSEELQKYLELLLVVAISPLEVIFKYGSRCFF